MSTSAEQFYATVVANFPKIKIRKEKWESRIKVLEDTTCAHWNNRGFKVKEGETTNVGRVKTVLWSKQFTCHRRSDVYKSKAATDKRPVQKESKKNWMQSLYHGYVFSC